MVWGIKIKKIFLLLILLVILSPIYSISYRVEQPYSSESSPERASPSDWVKESQIKVYDNRVVIEISNAEWARFTDTNSMDPVIDAYANAIEVVPDNYNDVGVGDIVSYEVPEINGTIIHRVIETGFDSEGWYAIAKGDNSNKEDPFKIRFENIKRVVVGIIY